MNDTAQQPAAGFGEDTIDLFALAAAIADDAARETIESCCTRVVSGEHDWYDLKTCHLDDWHYVDRAATWLDRRGDTAGTRMVRSKAFPHLVRFEGTS